VENLTVADADGGFLVRIGYHEVWRVTGAEIRRFWGEAAKSEVDFSGATHINRDRRPVARANPQTTSPNRVLLRIVRGTYISSGHVLRNQK
jgi:hypothetical protein